MIEETFFSVKLLGMSKIDHNAEIRVSKGSSNDVDFDTSEPEPRIFENLWRLLKIVEGVSFVKDVVCCKIHRRWPLEVRDAGKVGNRQAADSMAYFLRSIMRIQPQYPWFQFLLFRGALSMRRSKG